MQFDWTGDATAAAVAITGQLSLPAANEGPVTVWCIDSPSTLRIVGTHGELVLSVGLRGASPCSATGEATTSVGAVSGCVDVSS